VHTHVVHPLGRDGRLTALASETHPLALADNEPEQPDDALWKTRRVARFLDVSPETVLRYYRQGQLRGHRLAGQPNVLRFRRHDVLTFIDDAPALDP
jgi:hypothetical protein